MSTDRIGIDIGATKIEIAVLGADGSFVLRQRAPTPHAYAEAIAAIARLVREAEAEIGAAASVGIGFPGRIDPRTGLLKSSTALDGHPFGADIEAALGREVRLANDAGCFALSEAVDGAGAGARVVFGAILGTGCGGGVVVDGRLLGERNGVSGEWGHNPFPFELPADLPGRACWCGQVGCNETVLAGPGLAIDCDGPGAHDASGIPARAAAGEAKAIAALDRHARRLARALAIVVNLIDPDAIVLGGGVSNMAHLYEQVPKLLPRFVFSRFCTTPVLRNAHGDSSGVRGAAWLWPR